MNINFNVTEDEKFFNFANNLLTTEGENIDKLNMLLVDKFNQYNKTTSSNCENFEKDFKRFNKKLKELKIKLEETEKITTSIYNLVNKRKLPTSGVTHIAYHGDVLSHCMTKLGEIQEQSERPQEKKQEELMSFIIKYIKKTIENFKKNQKNINETFNCYTNLKNFEDSLLESNPLDTNKDNNAYYIIRASSTKKKALTMSYMNNDKLAHFHLEQIDDSKQLQEDISDFFNRKRLNGIPVPALTIEEANNYISSIYGIGL